MGDFHRHAVDQLITKAGELGVDVPPEVAALGTGGHLNAAGGGALLWVTAHPEDADTVRGCCLGDAVYGADRCTCWEPVYDVEQQPPQPSVPQVRDSRCGDCAYRRDSPENAEEWTAEHLVHLAATGTPFWCHDGMRRPRLWRHPDGREVEGSTDDWRPAIVGAVPFRADGSVGLLCAGWAAEGLRQARQATEETE